MGAVFPVQAEHAEDDPRGRCDAEGDAGPAVHARHVEDDEHEEDGEQAAGKEIEVLRLEAEELHVLPDALVQLVFHTARRLQEERPQYRGRYDQEHAGPEPAAGGLARVRIARGELGIHADGPDQPAERTGRVNQFRGRVKISGDHLRGLHQPGRPVTDGECGGRSCGQSCQQEGRLYRYAPDKGCQCVRHFAHRGES